MLHWDFDSRFILVILTILSHITWLLQIFYWCAAVSNFIADTCGPIIS